MKRVKFVFIFIALFVATLTIYGQSAIEKQISRLNEVSSVPYICRSKIGDLGCGDALFWTIVRGKLAAVPLLIEKLDDSTRTLNPVPNTGGDYTVADLALAALREIIYGIPILELAEDPDSPEPRNGGQGYWNYTRRKHANRIKFKKRVADWFDANRGRLIWVKSDRPLSCDCFFAHPNGGHYTVKQK